MLCSNLLHISERGFYWISLVLPHAHINGVPRQYLSVAYSRRGNEAQGKTAWLGLGC